MLSDKNRYSHFNIERQRQQVFKRKKDIRENGMRALKKRRYENYMMGRISMRKGKI